MIKKEDKDSEYDKLMEEMDQDDLEDMMDMNDEDELIDDDAVVGTSSKKVGSIDLHDMKKSKKKKTIDLNDEFEINNA